MFDATFVRPDLGAFCRLDELGLQVIKQRLEPGRAVLACQPVPSEFDRWCRGCGAEGAARDTVMRTLAHEPFGHRPTTLLVTITRFRCARCRRVWRQDTSAAAEPRAKLSRRALRWALEAIVCQHLSMARVAEALAVSWSTANNAVLDEGRRVLINDPHRFDTVAVIGVDEHAWRHTRRGDKYVTVIIDLTPVRDGSGPARLLDMVSGRSKAVFSSWLQTQPAGFRNGVEVVAMDGFTSFKTATAEQLPDATAVMDPFHVVALAGEAMHRCRQRVQQQTCGHRGRTGDPLYGIRRVLRTGRELLTEPQAARLGAVFSDEQHLEVEVSWRIYQRIVAAYRDPDRNAAKTNLTKIIASLRRGVPDQLAELVTLGRTLNRRAVDVLAYFDRPRTSNGPTEAINGRLDTPTRHRAWLPEPDQLHREIATRDRRLQTAATPSIGMSHQRTLGVLLRLVAPGDMRQDVLGIHRFGD